MRKLPAILSDIDGVVYRGGKLIARSDNALSRVLSSKFGPQQQSKLPFALLTNGGGVLEGERAKYINNIVYGSEEGLSEEVRLTAEKMILCHSPLKTLVPKYGDKFVLITGYGDTTKVAQDYGFTKAINCYEMLALNPDLCGHTRRNYPAD